MFSPEEPNLELNSLWAVEWCDGRLSVFDAANADSAIACAENEIGNVEDGWPDSTHRERRGVHPVGYVEQHVASRRDDNEPRFGRVVIDGDEFAWNGRRLPAPKTRLDKDATRLPWPPGDPTSPRQAVWSFVRASRDLVLFSAADDAEATAWARVYGDELGLFDTTCREKVEKFLLQLAPDDGNYAPTCYRVWIEGCKVGWPPTDLQRPLRGGPAPPDNLHAEARLAIPTYYRTRAVGRPR